MSDLGSSLHKHRLVKEGETVEGEITDIKTGVNFSSGWIGDDFLYEMPVIVLHCETSFGTLQLERKFKNIEESGLLNLLTDPNFCTKSETFVQSLTGATVYLAFGPDMNCVSLGATPDVNYSKASDFILRTGDDIKDFSKIFSSENKFATGYEKRSPQYLNQIVKIDYHRYSRDNSGWLPAELSYNNLDDKHRFEASVFGAKAVWDFEDSLKQLSKVEEFLETIGINYTPSEFDGEELIWIKPVRDLHHSNRPHKAETVIDDAEYWLASKEPLEGDSKSSVFERIKKFFSVNTNSIDVDITTTERARRARSSLEYRGPPIETNSDSKIKEELQTAKS